MNREILLRAWMKKKFSLSNASYDIFTLKELMSGKNDFYKYENWGRYTGLKDKNGTMIFEGDILKYAQYPLGIAIYEIGEVSNINGLLLIDGHSLTGTKIKKHLCSLNTQTENVCIGLNNTGDVEVIGNIYEDKIK